VSKPLVSIHRADPRKADVAAARWRLQPRAHDPQGFLYPTPAQPLIVSVSEIGTFLRCRTKWYWQYQCRLESDSGGDGDQALAIGDLVHQILERWYRAPYNRRTRKRMRFLAPKVSGAYTEKQLTPENRKLAVAMCMGYAAWVLDRSNDDCDRIIGLANSKRLWPEQFFELPLVPDRSILLRGKIDLPFIPTNAKHTLAFKEYKTRAQFQDEDVEILIQNTGYIWSLFHPELQEQMQLPFAPKYIIGHFQRLRKQMPTDRVKAPLFDSLMFERSASELEQWRQDTVKQALDMLDAALYPTPDKSCAWECQFRKPCVLRGNKSDLVHIMKSEYRRRP
jgi:hypothetical protein